MFILFTFVFAPVLLVLLVVFLCRPPTYFFGLFGQYRAGGESCVEKKEKNGSHKEFIICALYSPCSSQ